MFSESVGQTVLGEKCVSNCGAILETSDKESTLLTDVWGGGGDYSCLFSLSDITWVPIVQEGCISGLLFLLL